MKPEDFELLFEKVRTSVLDTLVQSNPKWAERWFARHEYCRQHGLQYYGLYTMEGAALHLCDVSTTEGRKADTSSIKRWTRGRKLGFVNHGADQKRIFGYQIADFHLDNTVERKWDGVERRKCDTPSVTK